VLCSGSARPSHVPLGLNLRICAEDAGGIAARSVKISGAWHDAPGKWFVSIATDTTPSASRPAGAFLAIADHGSTGNHEALTTTEDGKMPLVGHEIVEPDGHYGYRVAVGNDNGRVREGGDVTWPGILG
jgi:hypothetical protein